MIYELSSPTDKTLHPTLTAYPTPIGADNTPDRRPAVIICPGGSYTHVSYREGHPVALRFQSYGMSAFVLDYSVVDKPFPTALAELAEAVSFVRKNAEEWYVDPGKVIVCGFSAGGHLAASLAVHHGSELMKDIFGDANIRPDGQILCYPVITSGEYTHKESMANISRGLDEAALKMLSLEKNVGRDTPPAFVWHCADDRTVPVENTIEYIKALSAAGIAFETHIFPEGGHGIALCDDTALKMNDGRYLNETAAQWFGLALDWIRRNYFVKYR